MAKLTSIAGVMFGAVLLGGCAPATYSLPDLGGRSSPSTDNGGGLSRGLYAVAGVGTSRLEPDASQVDAFTVNDSVEPAGQLTIGADLTKHFSIEAHTADLGSAGFSPGGRINYHINGASALFYVGGNRSDFRRQGFTAFGRVGVGVLENTPVGPVPFTRDNETHVLFGAGVEYMTSIGLGLRVEGVSFDEDVQYAQLGLIYRTGRKQKSRRPQLVVENVVEQPVIAAAISAREDVTPVEAVSNQCGADSTVLESLSFQLDSDRLTQQSRDVLKGVADTLSNCDGVHLDINAHTDAHGSESYNKDLSSRRAQAVVQFLVSNGFDENSMRATAFGESQPIDTNDTPSGRARNRRVELHVR